MTLLKLLISKAYTKSTLSPIRTCLSPKLNPIAFLMDQCRNVMLYNHGPNFIWLIIWFIAGCLLSWIGVVVIHKYENSYAKVI